MSKIGYIPAVLPPPDSFKDLDEVVDYLNDMTTDLQNYIKDLFEEFDGKISIINLKHITYTVNDTGTANTDFTIDHNVGTIPTDYLWNIDTSDTAKAGIVYKGSSSWTTTQAIFRCTVANSKVRITLLFQ